MRIRARATPRGAKRETRGMTATIGPCISADSHITEPPGTYIDRIDPDVPRPAPRLHHHDVLGDVMLIDNGKSLVPFWLVAAAGRPTEEVRLDSRQDASTTCGAAAGIPVARLPTRTPTASSPRSSTRRSACCSATTPTPSTSARASTRTTSGSPSSARPRPSGSIGLGQTALVTPEDGIRDLEAIKRARPEGRDAAGHPAREGLRRPDVRRALGRDHRSRAAAVVPHPHEQQRHARRRPRPRPEAQQLHEHRPRQPGHHRHAHLRRGVRTPSGSARSCASRPTRVGRRTGCTAPTTATTVTATG